MSDATDDSSHGSWTDSIGPTAWQTGLGLLIVLVLGIVAIAVGFFVYTERVTAEPFLLLVGIIVGFLLGRIDTFL